MAKIISVGYSNPERCLTQKESWENLNKLRKLSPLEKKFYKKFMLDEGIESRYLALDDLKDIFCEDQDKIIERYEKAAPDIAYRSCDNAISKANISKDNIEFLATASCTGYLCPGLSSYILERSGLPNDISVLDLQGMGCGAALPALSSAAGFLHGKEKISYAIANCTEICSAAIYWDDDLGLILSNSIFGDGSASAILTNDSSANGPEILDYRVINLPEKREALRFKIKQNKLHNVLSSEVPEIASATVKQLTDKLLNKYNLDRSEIKFWAIHSGGRKVLSKIGEKLGLSDNDLNFSREILRKYGNMSSPSVLFALGSIIDSGIPRKGDYGIMLSFGAGFSCFGMLLRW